MLRFLFLLLLLVVGRPVFSQNEVEKKPRKLEIGLNITSTLAGFFNSGGDRTPADPFLLSLKFGGKKSALRIGANVRTNQKDESTTGLNGSRTTFDTEIFTRFGYEIRKEFGRRFVLFYGLDALGELESSKVDFNSSIGLATLTQRKTSAGGGPFLGMTWQAAPRISFGTEATLYATVYRTSERREIPLEPVSEKKAVGFDLFSVPPTSLYVHFKF